MKLQYIMNRKKNKKKIKLKNVKIWPKIILHMAHLINLLKRKERKIAIHVILIIQQKRNRQLTKFLKTKLLKVQLLLD